MKDHLLVEHKETITSFLTTPVCEATTLLTPPANSVSEISTTTTVSPTNKEKAQNQIFEMECEICTEMFTSDVDLRTHINAEHKNFNYNCKLCNLSFTTYEDHISHRLDEGHLRLSKAVRDEFLLQVGNKCNECQISETRGNTHYNFCEDDTHIDLFEHIWNSRQCGSMPV